MPDGFSGKGPNNYQNNVLGYPLKPCSMDPLTGFYKPQELEFYLKLFIKDKHLEIKTKEAFQEYYNAFKPAFKTK